MVASVEAGKGVLAARVERREPEQRQGRWMSELEKAMFAPLARMHGVAAPLQFAQPGGAEWRDAGGSGLRPSAVHDVAAAASRGGSRPAAVSDGGSPPAAAAQVQGTRMPSYADAAAEPQRQLDQRSRRAQEGMAAVAGAGARLAVRDGDGADAVTGACTVGHGAALALYAGNPGAALAMDATGLVQPLPLAGAGPVAFNPALATSSAAPAPQPGIDCPEPPAATGGADGGEAGSFEKRALHVFMANDGVHAFIRDAGLRASELGTLAQALAAELAGGGKSLAALTVNGKPVERTALARREEDEMVGSRGEGDDAAALEILFKPVLKGNS
jgi:hypothetical protein